MNNIKIYKICIAPRKLKQIQKFNKEVIIITRIIQKIRALYIYLVLVRYYFHYKLKKSLNNRKLLKLILEKFYQVIKD